MRKSRLKSASPRSNRHSPVIGIVPKQMRRDGPSFERGAVVGGVGGGAPQTVFDAKAGAPLPQMIGEQGRAEWTGVLPPPAFQGGSGGLPQRHCPLLAAFS